MFIKTKINLFDAPSALRQKTHGNSMASMKIGANFTVMCSEGVLVDVVVIEPENGTAVYRVVGSGYDEAWVVGTEADIRSLVNAIAAKENDKQSNCPERKEQSRADYAGIESDILTASNTLNLAVKEFGKIAEILSAIQQSGLAKSVDLR